MDNVALSCRLLLDVGASASCSSNALVNNAGIDYAPVNVHCAYFCIFKEFLGE